ncbi:hypothetical protein [Belnapia sp. F-4-1]|uniref:hypothetical protein n=1 Tax=Belnapia sp. F-4-1 TaxID=1545443 RepID=UPI0005B81BD3|nr:hypothetical protein [Belnapia sp. F-4-1]
MNSPLPDPAVDALEAASEDDRLWFEAHPHRQHRIRPYKPGEGLPGHPDPAPLPGHGLFVAVRQVQPGMRVRLSFYAEGEPATGEYAASRRVTLLLRRGQR